MKILSIDASTSSSGWAVFEDGELIEYGCIKSDKKDFRHRIADMVDELDKVVKRHSPDKLYCEDVPLSSSNTQVLKMLCVLQGALLGMGIGNHIYIEFIQPSAWRSKIGLFDGTSKGKERDEMKRKSIEFANEKFGLELIYKSPSSKFNQDDESDSICLGYSVFVEEKAKKTFGRKAKV